MGSSRNVSPTGGISGKVTSAKVVYRDGFSPTITVEEDTEDTYILKVTNKDGSYSTPNLLKTIQSISLASIDTLFK